MISEKPPPVLDNQRLMSPPVSWRVLPISLLALLSTAMVSWASPDVSYGDLLGALAARQPGDEIHLPGTLLASDPLLQFTAETDAVLATSQEVTGTLSLGTIPAGRRLSLLGFGGERVLGKGQMRVSFGTPNNPKAFLADAVIDFTDKESTTVAVNYLLHEATEVIVSWQSQGIKTGRGGTNGFGFGAAFVDPGMPAQSAKVIGYADFQRSTLPENIAYEGSHFIEHLTSDGTPATPPEPFVYPLGEVEDRLYADAVQTPVDPPLDHLQDGTPIGLRIAAPGPQGSLPYPVALFNGIRFKTPEHDGHLLYIAEYAINEGAGRRVVVEEYSGTRAKNPPLPISHDLLFNRDEAIHHRLTLQADEARATHLLRLAVVQLASFEERQDQSPATHHDPRRWTVEGKRHFSDYPAHVEIPSGGDTTQRLDAHLASLQVVDGFIRSGPGGPAQIPEGEPYVIKLPASTLKFSAISDQSKAVLNAAWRNRVFLIADPGRTYVEPEIVRDLKLDLGWLMISPSGQWLDSGGHRFVGESHLRFYGCVIADPTNTTNASVSVDTATSAGERGAIIEFYNCYFATANGPGSNYGVGFLPFNEVERSPRILVANSLMDTSNDLFRVYGSVALLSHGNYYLGNGAYRIKNMYQHQDTLGQFASAPASDPGSALVHFAEYFCMMDPGPNYYSAAPRRGSASPSMVQDISAPIWERYGNAYILPQDQITQNRMDWFRFTPAEPHRKKGGYAAVMAGNLYLTRPQTYDSDGAELMNIDYAGFDGQVELGVTRAFDNIGLLKTRSNASYFTRMVNLLPDEQAAGRLGYPSADDAFHSLFKVSGKADEGYREDSSATTYAGTDREGFLSPQDIELSEKMRQWDPSMTATMPQHGERLKQYPELPENLNAFLGYDGSESALPANIWANDSGSGEPFFLNEQLQDPWRVQPGFEELDEHGVVISGRIDTPADGILMREEGADGSYYQLEMLPKTHQLRFSVFGSTAEGNPLRRQYTSYYGLEAGSSFVMQCDTRWRERGQENFLRKANLSMWMRHHQKATGKPLPISVLWEAAATPPTVDASVDRHWWINTADQNIPYQWNGEAWVPLQGLEMLVAGSFVPTCGQGKGPDITQYQLSPQKHRKFFAHYKPEDMQTALGSMTPLEGDAYYARRITGAKDINGGFNEFGAVYRDGQWLDRLSRDDLMQTKGEIINNPFGFETVGFRIDGKPPILEQDFFVAVRSKEDSRPLPRGRIALGQALPEGYSGKIYWLEAHRGRAMKSAITSPDPDWWDVGSTYAYYWMTHPLNQNGERFHTFIGKPPLRVDSTGLQ